MVDSPAVILASPASALVEAQARDGVCAICKKSVFEDGGNVQWLACGHCYHKDCIDEYCHVIGTPLEGIRCPECRKGLDDINAAAQAQQSYNQQR